MQLKENGTQRLKLDCTELVYISSAGIRVLLKAYKTLQSFLSGVNEDVGEVIAMTGLLDMLDQEGTENRT